MKKINKKKLNNDEKITEKIVNISNYWVNFDI